MERRIAHLDMDAFYASVEMLRYPMLRGLPVVIGGRRITAPRLETGLAGFQRLKTYAGRGVVTTATYEARAFGVHSGMGLMKAAALAPDAILLPADFDQYRHYSRLFKQVVAAMAPNIEDRGIDEIFIDLTEVEGDALSLAQRIKADVQAATSLSCSIGIAPNKLLAKLASDLDKPGGLTLLLPADLPNRVWPLPVSRINGIGPRTSAKLAALGIQTIGDLAAMDRDALVREFGSRQGDWLAAAARGQDDRPLVTAREPKSVSRETTFERDLHPNTDRERLSAILWSLCERLHDDLVRKGYRGKTIGIKIRFEDFRTVTRDVTLASATDDPRAIQQAARTCLRRVRFVRKIRLLGIRAGSLVQGTTAETGDTPDLSKNGGAPPLWDAE